ncbi:diaminopimelate epimerase [Campylobacter peloridis]|uniref:Diaminopimelate epimerase n=1 Tax=Campylobacter peloridis TaxID=488546 RepID=A0A5C7DMR2_9BACT|nr:diaminopimelate epimerase [Campylobacter peloridis]TXE79065.1 diaminopimelate epimerase [Campylobacter peloridis]
MKFYKYCASGNDFVVFADNEKQYRSELAKKMCNRYEGIGADGMIVILPHEKYDFEWEFYNCDGSRANMCGNGARAAAHFAHHVLKKSQYLNFITKAGLIKSYVDNNVVEVKLSSVKDVKDAFEYKDRIWQMCNTGVPHLVTFSKSLSEFDLNLCKELRDKYNANVNFAKIEGNDYIRVRTYERGVEAETLACGTGMGACFYLAHLNNKVSDSVKIRPKSNEDLYLRLEDDQVYLKGKVRCCFEADYNFTN